MKFLVGEYSGFCAGVNYTYNKALEEIKKGKIYCLGNIIHNEQVVSELESLGMITVFDIRDVKDNSRVIFRAHGEPLSSYIYAKEHNLDVVDLTCGRVKVIHNKVLKEKESSFIIVIGKRIHPEIKGTIGYILDDYCVIESEEDIKEAYDLFLKSNKKKIFIISQTTFSSSLFDELCKKIKKVFKKVDLNIDKSICDSTEKRQKECSKISKKSSAVIVIGSKKSSNTKELYEIACKNCKMVYFLEKVEYLKEIQFKKDDVIGIIAGASCPKYLIDEVKNYLNNTCL